MFGSLKMQGKENKRGNWKKRKKKVKENKNSIKSHILFLLSTPNKFIYFNSSI